ncbi:MAG: DUF3501 family protein [Pseudohongiellaceae bacterium]
MTINDDRMVTYMVLGISIGLVLGSIAIGIAVGIAISIGIDIINAYKHKEENHTVKKLTTANLMSIEAYEAQRPAIRQAIMEHKQTRRVALGPNAMLHFEDFMTMRYQVLELMRAEKITNPTELEEELESYNPLIPDGSNLKVTFMLEYPNEAERRERLQQLIGIEEVISIQIGEFDKIYPIANEDLPRSTPDKTSSVHFLRFEFPPEVIKAAKDGAEWQIYCDHLNYQHQAGALPDAITKSLLRDFGGTT